MKENLLMEKKYKGYTITYYENDSKSEPFYIVEIKKSFWKLKNVTDFIDKLEKKSIKKREKKIIIDESGKFYEVNVLNIFEDTITVNLKGKKEFFHFSKTDKYTHVYENTEFNKNIISQIESIEEERDILYKKMLDLFDRMTHFTG